ncbi:hypothetical protein DVA67_009090 [Solirubrobacter sp. CPCC 204708]|nr:hypothetical protein [Solirubrobacter deserti]
MSRDAPRYATRAFTNPAKPRVGERSRGERRGRLWGLLEPTGRHPDVVAPTVKRHEGINTHRAAEFATTTRRGIPVTTPAQTIVHLSAVASFETLRRAVNQAPHAPPPHGARSRHARASRREEAASRARDRGADPFGERGRAG